MDTEQFLAHHGIIGMKWGRHKAADASGSERAAKVKPKPELVLTKKFSTGDSVSIYKNPTPFLGRQLAKISPTIKNNITKSALFSLKDKDGSSVGEAAFHRKSDTELSLDWIGIKTKHRGKGYASAALQGVVKYAQAEGVTKLTLEVPGNAPDARHIYEKLGFKDDPSRKKQLGAAIDPVWGGLTGMVMHLDNVKHAADLIDDSDWETVYAKEFAEFLSSSLKLDELPIVHSATLGEFLIHHGIA